MQPLPAVSSGGGSSRRSPVPVMEGTYATTLELPTKPLTPQEKAARKKKEMREKVTRLSPRRSLEYICSLSLNPSFVYRTYGNI